MMVPESDIKCRCGRATFPPSVGDELRTCSKCGYTTHFCKCKRATASSKAGSPWLSNVSANARSLVGVAVLSSAATLFAVLTYISPFLAFLGLGMPLALSAAFFAYSVRESRIARMAANAGREQAPRLRPAFGR
jgi:hypothetical protein